MGQRKGSEPVIMMATVHIKDLACASLTQYKTDKVGVFDAWKVSR